MASASFSEPQYLHAKGVNSVCGAVKVKLPIIEVLPFNFSIVGSKLASCINCSWLGENFEIHSLLKITNLGFFPRN